MAKKAFKRLTDLGVERLALLNSHLMVEDMPLSALAEMIQGEWLAMTDVSKARVVQMLSGYKARYIVPQQAKIAAKLTGDAGAKKLATLVDEFSQGMSVVSELEAAVRLQIERVQKLKVNESVLPGQLRDQTNNLYLLTTQLKELANLQMDLGILKRVPAKLNIASDVSDEDMKFVAQAKLHSLEAGVMMEALNYLKEKRLLAPASEQTVVVEAERPKEEE